MTDETPDKSVFLEPAWRLYREWTPDLLRSAEILADSGNLSLAADLCETMMGDDRIKAVLDQRTDTLLGLPLSFEAGYGRKKNRALRAIEAEEDWYAAFPESEQKMLHSWGLMLGVGLAEIRWTDWTLGAKGQRGRTLPRIVAKNPRNLRYDYTDRVWKLRVADAKSPSATEEIVITPGDGKWILYTPASESRPWVWGSYRALSRWSLLKRYAIQDWGFHSEKLGQGVWVVEGTGPGLTNDQRKMIAGDLQSLGRNAALALPLGFKLSLIESVAKTYESFQAQIATADNGAAVSLLGQNLSTQAGQTGNQGAATLHGKVALGKTKFDDQTLSSMWRAQALTFWAAYNFGESELAPWPVRDTTPTADKKEQAAVEQMLSQADVALVNAGVMTVNEARAKRDLPPIKGGDEMKSTVPVEPTAPITPANDAADATPDEAAPADEEKAAA